MAYDSSGNFKLDTRKLKVTMLMDIDVIADLSITPEEVMDYVKEGLRLKKHFEKCHFTNISVDYKIQVEDDAVDVIKV